MLPPPITVRNPILLRRMDNADDATSPGISLEYSYHFPHGIVVSTASTKPRQDAIEPAAADAVVAAAAGNYYFICNSIIFPCC